MLKKGKMFNIFEQSWSLLIVAILTLFIILTLRRIFPEKRRWWQLILPAFLAIAAFTLDFSVKTDLEKINAVINIGARAVEKENPDAIEAIISESYCDSYHNTKEVLMRYCRIVLSEPLVEKNYKTILEIEISQPEATVILTARIVFDKRSYVYDFNRLMLTKVKLELQKESDDQWLINRSEILEINRQPAKWRDIK